MISQSTQSSRNTVQVTGSTVTNDGSFQATSGLLDVATAPTNYAAGTLSGGAWIASGSGVIRIPAGNSITTIDATVVLDGPAADLEWGLGSTRLVG